MRERNVNGVRIPELHQRMPFTMAVLTVYRLSALFMENRVFIALAIGAALGVGALIIG